jgi:RNA polymerase sigma-70 factor (ECF subfamily)
MLNEPTDLELVREVLEGRIGRFEVLVHRYQRLVATAALRMGVPRQEVEDVTNEVFYKVYRSLKRYEPKHAMSTWLYRITVNAALDRKRSLRHESRMSDLPDDIRDEAPAPDDLAQRSDRARLLHRALERIPEHYRSPLMLMHVEGLPVEEVSRILHLPEGTVKSRLFRARAMLKEIIMRHYPALAPVGDAGDAP